MQLERVGAISVSGVLLKILWEVDDLDRLEGAFLQVRQTGVRRRHALGETRLQIPS